MYLSGRSEFVIEAAGSGPADFVLEPWTPAILATPETAKVLGARDSGKAELVDRSVAQPDQRDRLGITTAIAPCRAEFRAGTARQRNNGADAGGPQGLGALVSSWEAARSALAAPAGSEEPVGNRSRNPVESTFTCTTPARALRSWKRAHGFPGRRRSTCASTADRAGGLVNWKTEWRLELDPRNPRPLEIELDPGLELIDVQGPAVRGYQSERSGDRDAAGRHAGWRHSRRRPSCGYWPTPRCRRRVNGRFRDCGRSNATWTGGTTTVFLDEFHVMKECREKAGRRVFPTSAGFRSGRSA